MLFRSKEYSRPERRFKTGDKTGNEDSRPGPTGMKFQDWRQNWEEDSRPGKTGTLIQDQDKTGNDGNDDSRPEQSHLQNLSLGYIEF